MAINKSLTKATQIPTLILLILTITAVTSTANNARDSIDSIQVVLPDSISLGGKVVYIDFWASWCGPCRLSFSWMEKLYNKYHKKGLEIIAVSVDKDHDSAIKFLNKNKAIFPIVFDSTGDLAKQYGLEVMPTSFIYSRDGSLVYRNQGFQQDEADSIDQIVLKLLKEGKFK